MRRDDAKRRPASRRAPAWKIKPTVEGVEKRILMAVFTVKNLNDDLAVGSLRYAITQLNASTDATNTINFNIAASGVQTIPIRTPLPAIAVPATIDGTSERGYAGTPLVVLSGAGAGLGLDGLDITAGSTTVQGLAFNSFSGEGINLSGSGSNTIRNNYIGINPNGVSAAANGLDGVLIQTGSNSNNIVGNVISGNTANGIFISGNSAGTTGAAVSGTVISGNLIGTTAAGTATLNNGGDGIYVLDAPMTTIGGTTAAARNVISGNANGMELFGGSDGTVVEGNYIGTNAAGTARLGNIAKNATTGTTPGDGILLQGISNLTIGGTTAGARNVISGNLDGIASNFNGGTAVAILGNFIGTNAAGNAAVGNTDDGIALNGTFNATIGGTTAAARNVISGNTVDGISASFFASGLVIRGNYIGTDVSGALPLGNGGAGINTAASGTIIGGIVAGAGNVIANNGAVSLIDRSGVIVSGVATSILSNSIYNSQQLGIELDGGGNQNLPAPTITSAVSHDTFSVVNGTLSAPNGSYTLQFFYTPGLNASGNAEGETLIGTSAIAVTGGVGVIDNLTLSSGFLPGAEITATATDAAGNTSRFSLPVIGTGSGAGTKPPTITVASAPATVAAGQNVTDTFTITNTGRVADLGVAFYDTVPAGTTFFSGSSSSGAFVVNTNGVVNASLGTLLAGQSVTVTIVLTAGAGSVPSFTNVGGVTATTPTVNQGDDTASATTRVTAATDLAVSVVGPVAATPVGQDIVYQVTLSNNGPSDAAGVSLVDTLPAGTTFVSASSTDGRTPTVAGSTVTDAVGTLAAGSLVVLTITVATNGGTPTSITDSATATTTTPDADPTNNTGTAVSATIPSADLALVSDTATPAAVVAGNTVTFTIDVANAGPSPAAGTVVTDVLPAGLTFLSGTTSVGGPVALVNGVVTAQLGTLPSGGTAVVTIVALAGAAGSVDDSSAVASSFADPNPGNNTGSASVTVAPVTDVAVSLGAPSGSANTGNPITYTAVITNAGPSPATNAVLTDPLFAGATFVSATSSAGTTGTLANGVVTVPLGTIAAGQSVTVTLVILPTQPGTVTNTVTVVAAEPDSNTANNSASVTTVLAVPAPLIEFSAPTYSVDETGGAATITLVRIGDTSGTISVNFSTVAGGNATPGLDYTPVAQVVTFAPGVTTQTVSVPVLADPYDRANEFVALQLDTPVNAVLIGNAATSSAVLGIVNVDPVVTGPTIADVKLIGPASSIAGIEIDTTGNIDPATASDVANYSIVAYGGGAGTLAMGTIIPVSLAVYNPATGAVLLIPSTPLPANQLFLIDINGTRAGALADRAGNPLNSVYGATAASDYLLTVARGNNLNYTDENGAQVNLKVTGPGTLDIDRTVAGAVGRLQVLGPVAHKTTVSGSVKSASHRTNIGVILGLGQFGSVITKLYTPPFYVTNSSYPDPTDLTNGPAVDTLQPSAAAATTTTKGKATKATKSAAAKAKSAAPAKHPHAALAHAVHARTAR